MISAGDRVALVCPAGPAPASLLSAGADVLRSWGLDVSVHVPPPHPSLPYLAGTDADRARDLQSAWCSPDVRAVLCARGGYGCLRMLDHVDWAAMAAMAAVPPKVFAGSSDVTALHASFAALGVPTLFAPMPGTDAFVSDPVAQEHLRRALFSPVPVLTSSWASTVMPGVAQGVTVGGNASLLAAGLGRAPLPVGAIALLEDVDEAPYRLDRILTQLLRAGWFDDVRGIAFGSWNSCGDIEPVLQDRLGPLGVPIIGNLGFGHCPGQLTVPLGVQVTLDATARTLTPVAGDGPIG